MRLLLKATQFGLFGEHKEIKENPDNHLGVDRRGRAHWRATPKAKPTPEHVAEVQEKIKRSRSEMGTTPARSPARARAEGDHGFWVTYAVNNGIPVEPEKILRRTPAEEYAKQVDAYFASGRKLPNPGSGPRGVDPAAASQIWWDAVDKYEPRAPFKPPMLDENKAEVAVTPTATKILHRFEDPDTGMGVQVAAIGSGYSVAMQDLDSHEYLPSQRIFPYGKFTEADAVAYAEQLLGRSIAINARKEPRPASVQHLPPRPAGAAPFVTVPASAREIAAMVDISKPQAEPDIAGAGGKAWLSENAARKVAEEVARIDRMNADTATPAERVEKLGRHWSYRALGNTTGYTQGGYDTRKEAVAAATRNAEVSTEMAPLRLEELVEIYKQDAAGPLAKAYVTHDRRQLLKEREQVNKDLWYLDEEDWPAAAPDLQPALDAKRNALKHRKHEISAQLDEVDGRRQVA